MATISFKNITPIKKIEPLTATINDQVVTIKQYLPMNEKLALAEKVLNQSVDDTGFFNPGRLEVYYALEVINAYTNINLTEKMMEDSAKTYDALMINGVFDLVISMIPKDEYEDLFSIVEESADHVAKYLSSFAGVMKTVSNDYQETSVDVDKLVEKLDRPEDVALLKDVLAKIG